MNLARFGVVIDPAPAQAGARATIAAARSIGPALDAVARQAGQANAAQATLGRTGEQAGSRVDRGMRQAAGGTREAGKAAKEAAGGFEAMVGKVMNVVKALASAYAAMQVIRGAFSLIGDAIDKASEMEGFRTQWAYLLGSFDAAKAKMVELQSFANATPFDLPGVTKSALALQSLTDTGLDTIDGLRSIGDAAARAGQPIEEVASRITRLVGNLKRGGSGGDELNILGEWRVLSGDIITKLKEGAGDAKNFASNLALVKEGLEKSENAMLLMSTTWQGITSTLSDSWGTALAKLGTPIIEGLKPAILEVTKFVDGIGTEVETWAPQIEQFARQISAAVAVLNTHGGLKLSLKAAADTFGVYFKRGVIVGSDIMKSRMGEIGNELWRILKEIADRFIKALLDGLKTVVPAVLEVATSGARNALTNTSGYYAKHIASVGAGVGIIPESDLPEINKGIDTTTADTLKEQTAQIEAAYGSWKDAMGGVDPNGPSGDLFPQSGDALDQIISKAEALVPATEAMSAWNAELEKQKALQDAAAQSGQDSNEELVKKANANREAGLAAEKAAAEKAAAAQAAAAAGGKGKDPGEAMREEAKRIIEATRTPDEVFNETKDRLEQLRTVGILNEEQYQRAVRKSTDEYKSAMEQQAAAAQAAVEKQMTPLQKLATQWGALEKNVGQAMASITQALADNVSQGLTSMIDGTKSAKEAFADMAKGIVAAIVKIVVQLAVEYAISAALGRAAPINPVNLAGLTAGVKHDGGAVGAGGHTRDVPASVFAGAQRFHSGGVIGGNEVPIIAEKGESVITKQQSEDIKDRLRGNQRQAQQETGVTILNVTDASMIDQHLMANPSAILNPISRNAPAIQRIINNGPR